MMGAMQKDESPPAAVPATPKDKSKSLTLRPVDQDRIAALRRSTGIDNDVDVVRFALAETCRARGVEVAEPEPAKKSAERQSDPPQPGGAT